MASDSGSARSSYGEERFRILADAAPVLVWVSGTDGLCTHFNRGWLEFRGRTLEEEQGNGWAEGVHADDLAACLRDYLNAFGRRVPFELRYRLRRADGAYRWVLDRGVPVFGEAGDFQGYVGACTDVTELEQARAQMAESEERLRLVAANAHDAVVILDDERRVTTWNRAAERLFGRPAAETLDRELDERLVPERYREPFRRHLAALTATGSGPAQDRTLEVSALHPDGTELPIELSVSAIRVRERWHILGVARDITERRRAESVREELAAIVRSTSDAVVGKTLDGVVTSWNAGAERLYGYSSAEMIGQPLSSIAAPGFEGEAVGLIDNVLRGHVVEDHETQRRHRDGHILEVALTLSPIRDAHLRIVGISTIARDVTRRKRAELALRRTNRALRTLSSCNQALIRAGSEGDLLDSMCAVLVEEGGFSEAWIGLVDAGDASLVPAARRRRDEAGKGPSPRFTPGADLPGYEAACLAVRERLPRVEPTPSPGGAIAAIPLVESARVHGAIVILAGSPDVFDEEEMTLANELACDIAFGIETQRTRAERLAAARERQRFLEELRQNLEDTVSAIAATVEARDPYTAGHQRRVAALAAAIAREMGLEDDEVHGIHLAGAIHDLGKLRIPAEILANPGRLSDIERRLIQVHPEAGYEIVKGIGFPWPIADMILQHHERLDGSGYPKGLRGDAISRGARILAVADAVEAMASHRPYRPSRGLSFALAQIESDRGTLFDAAVVDASLRLLRERGYDLGSSAAPGRSSDLV